jgi:hypothetical protein
MNMKLLTKIGRFLGLIAPVVLSEGQKAVAAIASSDVGKTIADEIGIIASAKMTGAEKFEAVVAKAKPLLVELAADGPNAIVDDVEDLARAVVQEIYNRVASLTIGVVAKAILKALGIK